MELFASLIPASKAREMMRSKFPTRDYATPLVSRLLQKGLSFQFGDDPECIAKLKTLGSQYLREGGVYDFKIAQDLRISDIMSQPSMKNYISLYGDCIIQDGTHGCTAYAMILVINILFCQATLCTDPNIQITSSGL